MRSISARCITVSEEAVGMDIKSVLTALFANAISESAGARLHCVPRDCVVDELFNLGTELSPALFGIANFFFSPSMASLRDV